VKQQITTLFAGGVLALALFGAAMAGPLEDGQAAVRNGDYATAMQYFRVLADQGNAVAQNNLGFMYDQGLGVPQNYAQAVVWYRKAADQGDAAAQNNLGRMYDGGHGVPQDYAQAVVWLRKAAEQGNALGQVNLGTMYDHGHGVPQDYAQAHMWYNLAASSAEDDAARNEAAKVRDLVATKMTPAQIAEAQRMAREWMQSHPSKR
jgi:TPR repeat protein